MTLFIDDRRIDCDFKEKIRELSGQNVALCMQCGTCTASCPMSADTEEVPRKLMQLIQLGLREEVLEAPLAWVCASCHTCMARCPRGIDITRVMEAVRQLGLRENVDHVNLSALPAEQLRDLPQIAFVSCFRKLTA